MKRRLGSRRLTCDDVGWAYLDLNQGPLPYQGCPTLASDLRAVFIACSVLTYWAALEHVEHGSCQHPSPKSLPRRQPCPTSSV